MMKLPKRVYEIIVELYERNKLLAQGTDDNRRELTKKIAEQTAFELGSSWGTKRADRGRPQSKDAIALTEDGKLYSYDWQNGSTRAPHSPAGEMKELAPPQEFIAVHGVNHIGALPPVKPIEVPGAKPYNEGYAVEFGLGCNEIYSSTKYPMDPGMIAVHSSRAAYDYYLGDMEWKDAKKKHLNNFRREYGLDPV